MSDNTYRLLKWFAIISAVLYLSYEGYMHFQTREPGDLAYFAGNNYFKDGDYKNAATSYVDALAENSKHLPALRGLANSHIQLGDYRQAMQVITSAISLDDDFAGHYATRGIIHDHLGKYKAAISDYKQALTLDEKLADGMHWLDRLLYNVQETPPTIANRMRYLEEQMKMPAGKRLLRVPEIDERQLPYEQ
jgi:tetratricopeptide (TPR) repeat protein